MRVRMSVFASVMAGAFVLFTATAALASGTVTTCDDAHLTTALSGGGTVTFNCGAGPTTITLATRKTISAATTIDGGGLVTLDGGGAIGLFTVSGVSFTVQNITLANGRTTANGDGGAAINSNGGAVTIDHSTIFGNSTANAGCGAIVVSGAALTITNSTMTGNHEDAAAQAGLLCTNITASLTMSDSTVAGNYSGTNGGGGAISTSGPATFTNCTIANNTSHNDNGAVNADGTVTFQDTIIANNPGGNCLSAGGSFVDGGHNLQYPGNSCGATITIADPLLLALANNGGPTQTMALQFGSPAIDAGNPATCLATDQRGHARIGVCDIGAIEFDPSAPGATPIPTLGGRAILLLAALLALLGALLIRR
ncbi:MAG: choice-of-anchor Q domain-containing protein [Thermoanaerobaculales bacterium]